MPMPPGLAGYLQGQQLNNQNQAAELQQATGTLGILQKLQEQHDAQALKGALATGDIDAVARINPQMAGILSRLQTEKTARDQSAREQAVFSPENIARNTSAGSPAIPSPTDIQGNPLDGPARPAIPGQINVDALRMQAATTGPKGLEAYSTHVAQENQRRDNLQQQLTLAKQRSEDQRLSRQEQIQAREDMIRLTASLRPQPQEPMLPVQQQDGSVVYMPRSQAAGQKVGGRISNTNLTTQVQQLGKDFEKAGLSSSIAVAEDASKITPELAGYITGPKSMMPDLAVPDDAKFARQAVQKLFNITLKDRSGAAVTNQEMERLKTEFGKGVLKTPQQLINAVDKAKSIIEKHYKGIAAGYGQNALDAYNQNLTAIGGTPLGINSAAPASNVDALLEKYK